MFQNREKIRAAGCHGKVSAARWDGVRLPYIDNLVNLLIVRSGTDVLGSEVQRVLAPYGVALVNVDDIDVSVNEVVLAMVGTALRSYMQRSGGLRVVALAQVAS